MARIKHIEVRGIRRSPPDYRKAGRALLDLIAAQAEAEAQAAHSAGATAQEREPQTKPAKLARPRPGRREPQRD